MENTTNFKQFDCDNCEHKTESNNLIGCAFFGLNKDEINGRYQDESRGKTSNEDLRRKHGVHIPREGTVLSGDRLLKDYTHNNKCTSFSDSMQ